MQQTQTIQVNSDIPMKYCRGECGRMLPATTQYFQEHDRRKYPGQLRNFCKDCRRNQKARLQQSRKQVQQLIATGPQNGPVAHPLLDHELDLQPPTTGPQNGPIPLPLLDQQEGLQSSQLDQQPLPLLDSKQSKKLIGWPDQCGSCGAKLQVDCADIYEDVDIRGKHYGYLCNFCYWRVFDFQGDFDRLDHVLTYLKKTRKEISYN